jgi:hypothetical protein
MNQIAAPAHISADEPERTGTIRGPSLMVLKSLISTFIRAEDDIAKRYEGSAWCDQTEHDLNYDVITGRRTKRP